MGERIFQQVETEIQKQQAEALIRAYLSWLNEIVARDYDLTFDIEAMMASDLTDAAKFGPPHGRFYVVYEDGQPAGVGALKRLEPGVAEVQRMFVSEAFRGRGLGRAIVDRLIADARAIGYHTLKLESLSFLHAAHHLYHSVGFRDVAPYDDNSMTAYQSAETLSRYFAITVFMEMTL